MAIDLLLFRKTPAGSYVFLSEGTEPEYRTLGRFWTTLHPLARWGGDFSRPDPDHFSLAFEGRA